MTDNNEDSSRPSADTIPPSSSPEHESSSSSSSTPTPMPDRTELLDKARHFLSSPQVVHQDYDSKRRFLTEKGLADGDIELLLREMVRPVFIPVRTTLKRVFRKQALAASRRAYADVSRTTPIPFTRSSRGYFQGALMANRKLHGSALYLLRMPIYHHFKCYQSHMLISCCSPPAIPASPFDSIGACPSCAQGTPTWSALQAHRILARI